MEIWKDVDGYEGLYQVSNKGNVKSLNYHHTGVEKTLKTLVTKDGYLYVGLNKDGRRKCYRIHRLVASAFIDNPDNLPEVNHKDECKTNNNVENLEWCTRKYNVNYGTYKLRMSETLKNRPDISIPVDMLTKNGEFIRQFPSTQEAVRYLCDNGYPKATHGHINDCRKCKRNTAYGYKWRYTKKELS